MHLSTVFPTLPERPSVFVRTDDGTWCPAYQITDAVLDGPRTICVIEHPAGLSFTDADRLTSLAREGRVVLTRPTARIHRLPRAESTWEAMRRLLNVRAGQLQRITGEAADDIRHRAAEVASEGRTRSSMALGRLEMDDAVTYVEHELHLAGFNLEAADAAYRNRVAA